MNKLFRDFFEWFENEKNDDVTSNVVSVPKGKTHSIRRSVMTEVGVSSQVTATQIDQHAGIETVPATRNYYMESAFASDAKVARLIAG